MGSISIYPSQIPVSQRRSLYLPLLDRLCDLPIFTQTMNSDKVGVGRNSAHHTLVTSFVDQGNEGERVGNEMHPLPIHLSPYLSRHFVWMNL
jgi:hypothetical protein